MRYILLILICLACSREPNPKIKVAASSTPHAQMLELIKPQMKEAGYNLEIIVIDDYQLPNRLLEENQIDANFFQHEPFLQKEIEEFHYHLTPIAKIHLEPLGIYSATLTSLAEIKEKARITIPSDPTNEARALYLLESANLITLKENTLLTATILDIEENPLSLKIQEIDPPLLTRTLNEVDLALIPANYALLASLTKPILLEQDTTAYVNILVVKQGNENKEALQLLAKLLKSEEIKSFIAEKYQGRVQLLK